MFFLECEQQREMVEPSTGKLERTLVTMIRNVGFSLGTVGSGVNSIQEILQLTPTTRGVIYYSMLCFGKTGLGLYVLKRLLRHMGQCYEAISPPRKNSYTYIYIYILHNKRKK